MSPLIERRSPPGLLNGPSTIVVLGTHFTSHVYPVRLIGWWYETEGAGAPGAVYAALVRVRACGLRRRTSPCAALAARLRGVGPRAGGTASARCGRGAGLYGPFWICAPTAGDRRRTRRKARLRAPLA